MCGCRISAKQQSCPSCRFPTKGAPGVRLLNLLGKFEFRSLTLTARPAEGRLRTVHLAAHIHGSIEAAVVATAVVRDDGVVDSQDSSRFPRADESCARVALEVALLRVRVRNPRAVVTRELLARCVPRRMRVIK